MIYYRKEKVKEDLMSEKKSKKINTLNYWIDIESSTPPNIKTSHFSNKFDSKWNQTVSFGEKGELLWAEPLSDEIEEPKEWIHKVFLGIYNTKYVIKEFSTKEDIEELRKEQEKVFECQGDEISEWKDCKGTYKSETGHVY